MRNSGRQHAQQVGRIRVQALSATLVRLEVEGPQGFEDRPSFRVRQRVWPGVALRRSEREGWVHLRTADWQVQLPRDAQDLEQVCIRDRCGGTLFRGEWPASQARELPAPGSRPHAWAFADWPRLIPPAWGATPAPEGADNPASSGWDLGNDAPDLFVFLPCGDYRQLRADLLRLTGPTELPPLYLFGGFHSRYYPYRDQGLLALIREYRERRFPLDVVMLDTDWRVGGSYGYEINTRLFPDFQAFLEQAHRLGVHIGITDHPKAMTENALHPKEMTYRYANLARFLWMGIDFWWFDRNWDVCLTGPLPVLCKEVWGMQVFQDMTRRAVPERRPLILANVDGVDDGRLLWPPDIVTHRFPFQWTGDTQLSWEQLQRGVENAVRAGVCSLVPYISDDVGTHEGMPSAEFYLRHWQYAALSAVLRPHCSNSPYFRREPWSLGPEVEALARDYLNLRYRLLPHLYAAARHNHDSGEPLLRRLDLCHPEHPEAAANDQYLLGDDLLVAPIMVGEPCNPTVPTAWVRTPDGQPGLGLDWFPNENLLGPPTPGPVLDNLHQVWAEPPGPVPPGGGFSTRWRGRITPGRRLQLGLFVDAGGRLYLDGQLKFDQWHQNAWIHGSRNHGLDADILEPGRTYDLCVEARHPGAGLCRLFYRPLDLPAQPQSRSLWLPEGIWIDAWTGQRQRGPARLQVQADARRIPLFLRAGSVFALAPEMQSTGEKPWDPITLEVFPQAGRVARCVLYEDDRWSNAYLAGECRRTVLSAALDPRRHRVLVRISQAKGSYQGAPLVRGWLLRLHLGPDQREILAARLDGKPVARWRVLPQGHPAIPLQGAGAAADAPVLELRLPAAAISRSRSVEIHYR